MKRLSCTLFAMLLLLGLAARSNAHPQWGIAVDKRGQVYFSDIKNIWKVGADGHVSVFRKGVGGHTHDINIDANDDLFGAENSYDGSTKKFFSGIWKMTTDGAFSWVVPMAETLPTGTSIWKDKQGNTYHLIMGSRPTVVRRSPAGVVTAISGDRKAAENYRQNIPYSGGMAFGLDDSLYFVLGSRVHKINSSGGLQNVTGKIVKSGGSKGTELLGLVVDQDSNVFVADWGNRRVLKISARGEQSTVLTSDGSWYPAGVAKMANDLYTLEESHSKEFQPLGTRVRKLAANGSITTIAEIDDSGKIITGTAPKQAEVSTNADSAATEGEQPSFPNKLLLFLLIPVAVTAVFVWRRKR